MRYVLILILCVLFMGCETWPILSENSAAYRTANETYIVENTTEEEFCNKVINDKEIIKAYYKGTELEWTNE